MQLCDSAEQPGKFHRSVQTVKDVLIVGGIIVQCLSGIMGYGVFVNQVKTMDTDITGLKSEMTSVKSEMKNVTSKMTSVDDKLDSLMKRRWWKW